MCTPAKNKSSVAVSPDSPVRLRASLESDKELSELTGQEPEACTSPMIKARNDRKGIDERVWTVPVSKVARSSVCLIAEWERFASDCVSQSRKRVLGQESEQSPREAAPPVTPTLRVRPHRHPELTLDSIVVGEFAHRTDTPQSAGTAATTLWDIRNTAGTHAALRIPPRHGSLNVLKPWILRRVRSEPCTQIRTGHRFGR